MLRPLPRVQDAKQALRSVFEISPDPRCSRPAFTLLELIIVLLVMVGIMAVAWPNLQRPLRRTTLEEAAELLRDAIDENRYQASLGGTPHFIELRQGSSEIRSGTFESFMAVGEGGSSFADAAASAVTPQAASQSGTASGSMATGLAPPRPLRSWRLPDTVVVSQVRWTLDAPVIDPLDGAASDRGLSGDELADPQARDHPGASGSFAGLSASAAEGVTATAAADARQWWLPLSATGRGRDATIELYDTRIQETLRVTYASATGALEISR